MRQASERKDSEFERFYFDGQRWLYWRPDGFFELFGTNGNGTPILKGIYRSAQGDDDPLDLDTGYVFIVSKTHAFLLTRLSQ